MGRFYLIPGGKSELPKDPDDLSDTETGQAVIRRAAGVFGEVLSKAGIEFVTEEHGDALDTRNSNWTVVALDELQGEQE